jgi:hypothetical protein
VKKPDPRSRSRRPLPSMRELVESRAAGTSVKTLTRRYGVSRHDLTECLAGRGWPTRPEFKGPADRWS